MKYQVIKQIILQERDTFNVGQIVTEADMGKMLLDLLEQKALKPVTEKPVPAKESANDKKAD